MDIVQDSDDTYRIIPKRALMDSVQDPEGTYRIIPNPGTKFAVIATLMYNPKTEIATVEAVDRIAGPDRLKAYKVVRDYFDKRIQEIEHE
jgi:hypothetical protein